MQTGQTDTQANRGCTEKQTSTDRCRCRTMPIRLAYRLEFLQTFRNGGRNRPFLSKYADYFRICNRFLTTCLRLKFLIFAETLEQARGYRQTNLLTDKLTKTRKECRRYHQMPLVYRLFFYLFFVRFYARQHTRHRLLR